MTLANDDDDAFVWQDYLETTNAEEVPHALFQHVEKSIESSLQSGLMLEVADKDDSNKYWLATIKMNCGDLLSVSYVGPVGVRMPEIWVNVGKIDVRGIGWCKQEKTKNPDTKVQLEPPDSLKIKHPDTDWESLVELSTKGSQSIPIDSSHSDGHTPIARLKQGMRVEVQDEYNPFYHWIATIIENIGGRLKLRYDVPENNKEAVLNDFWLFYLSPRLFRLGWVDEKGKPWQYQPPSITSSMIDDEDEEWGSVLETAKLEAELLPPPIDLFEGEVEVDESHLFAVGMKLETINPNNHVEICPATVIQTFPCGHFSIQVDSISGTEMPPVKVCTPGDPYIFPTGWSKSNDMKMTPPNGWMSEKDSFDWEEYLSTTMSAAAPDSCFVKMESALDMGYDIGQKLEAIDPENENQICAATITRTLNHLLWVHLDCYEDEKSTIIVSSSSQEIFPVGWCGSNSYPLKPPRDFRDVCRVTLEKSQLKQEKQTTSEPSTSKSSWCPKIYFNHKCFTGPYLSKGKIALLPKSVGPGPILLVLKEVLSLLISTAYKSRQVLKELTCDEKVPSNMHVEMLKAKLKTAIFSANVAIATSADQVNGYCKDVCTKMQSCPYLFGPNCNEGECPVGCSKLSKSQFTSYWSKKTKAGVPIDGQKRRGGRKRKPKIIEETGENGKEDESDQSSHGDADYKKSTRRNFPAFEMRTRKAKLPNFALLGSNWVWGSEDGEDYSPARKKRRGFSTESAPPAPPNSGEGIVRKRGRPRLDRNIYKTAAILGLTNPALWSKEDVSKYLKKTTDCSCLAERLESEDIDGKAFMLLNLPTLLENFKFTIRYAIKLCQHIELVKYAYLTEYSFVKQ